LRNSAKIVKDQETTESLLLTLLKMDFKPSAILRSKAAESIKIVYEKVLCSGYDEIASINFSFGKII